MKTLIFGERVEVRRETYIWPSNLKIGDWVELENHELCEVRTVQRDCPHLENLNKSFVALVLVTSDGFPKFLRSNGKKFHAFRA